MRNVNCHRFRDKVAIVTGGGSGIGEACTHRFVAEGARVVVVDIDDERGQAALSRLPSGEAEYVKCDVSQRSDWVALREIVLERFGRLDVLHHNAFIQREGAVHELSETDWDRVIDVNLKAAYLGTGVLVDLLADASGAIVLTSSVNAFLGRPRRPAYAASKAALSALGRQLAVEYGPKVRTNTVVPGAIETPPWGAVAHEHRLATERGTAAKRLGDADEVAAAVAFLASDDASYVTGVDLVVDGGWLLVKGDR